MSNNKRPNVPGTVRRLLPQHSSDNTVMRVVAHLWLKFVAFILMTSQRWRRRSNVDDDNVQMRGAAVSKNQALLDFSSVQNWRHPLRSIAVDGSCSSSTKF